MVVSNPVDVLTCLAQQLSGFPAGRVLGSGTVLDTARLKYLLGQRLGVDSRNVHAFIIGEHGDSELAVWSSANISGADLDDYCRIAGITEPADELSRIYEHVRDAAYQIIDSKGATYYGIGMAVRRITEALCAMSILCWPSPHIFTDTTAWTVFVWVYRLSSDETARKPCWIFRSPRKNWHSCSVPRTQCAR